MNSQTKFLRDCAKRTPIYKPDHPVAEAFAAVMLFAVLILANFL